MKRNDSRLSGFRIPSMLAAFILIIGPLGGVVTIRAQEQAENARKTSTEESARANRLAALAGLRWWPTEISRKPDSWYRTDEGKEMAERILSWQHANGGWPLMNTTRQRFTGDESIAGPWGTKGSLVGATVNEMRFLARGFRATGDTRYRDAALKAFQFIVNAQYPSGGWPKTVPPPATGYHRHATLNDNQMADLLTLLQEAATSRDFAFIGSDNRKLAADALNRGIDFLLKSQITVNGRLTAWAQQHDEVTYEPRPARAFEPAAISGGESADILQFLMSIPKPSPEMIRAVEGGVQWYRESQIDGYELTTTAEGRTIRANPNAGPLWARFYEIGTNRPIFAGRDGVIKYSMSEIEPERRNGYAWYNRNGLAVFERHAQWRHERQWDALPPTNTDESQTGSYALPDPLVLLNGEKVSSVEQWEMIRRPELLKLFEEHQHGRTPMQKVPMRVEVVEKDGKGLGGLARRIQVRIRFDDDNETMIRVLLYVPASKNGPVPTLLHLSFSPNVLSVDDPDPGIDEGWAWSATLQARVPDRDAFALGKVDVRSIVERGFGMALVYYGDIEPDFDHDTRYGVRAIFSPSKSVADRKPEEWGAIGAWAWGLSRVLDYLQTDTNVDGKRVALSGVSRLGKTVLWAAAQDQRFAMVIPMLSGEGGAAISRRNYGETVADLTNPHRYDYWFARSYANYAFDVHQLPVDGHMLLALQAPRPVLQIVGTTDTWSDFYGEWVAAIAAGPVYELYQLPVPQLGDYPQPDQLRTDYNGFFLHNGGHTVLPQDYQAIADFMDKHFVQGSRD